jgi:predicted HAD superfamily hydrolase
MQQAEYLSDNQQTHNGKPQSQNMAQHNILEPAKALIREADVVSFDIFDTLVTRCVAKPIDIFHVAAQRLNIADTAAYQHARIEAERIEREAAQKSGRHEVTLHDILKRLKQDNRWIAATVAELIACERSVEIEACIPNRPIQDLYVFAKSLGKRVILTSDMYLDESCINEILKKCGYTRHDRLYLSSQALKTKHNGSLFDHILQEECITPTQMAHIGDNKRSDFQQPTSRSIKSFHLTRSDHFNNSVTGRRYHDAYKKWNDRLDEGLHINQKCIGQPNFWHDLGYTYMGPLLYSFITWMIEQMNAQRPDRVFFLARDGHIINRAFDILAANGLHDFKHDYMYASRRSWLFPAIKDINEKSLSFLCSGKNLRVRDHLDRIGISPEENIDVIRRSGFSSPSFRVENESDYEKLRALYKHLSPQIIHRSNQELINLKNYLSDIGALQAESIAVVDIGWHGTLQEALLGHLQSMGWSGNLTGYYFGTFVPAKLRIEGGLQMNSYACHCGFPEKNLTTILKSVEFFEWFFSAPHGSVINFSKTTDGSVKPNLEDNDFEQYRTQSAAVAQDAALDYVSDRLHIGRGVGANKTTAEHALRMLESLLTDPTILEANLIGDIPHVEGFGESREVRHLAKPSGSIFNPAFIKRARIEYGRSHWKAGFKKRLLGPLHKLV